ncbi:hypothetical protein BDB00DRAFT_783347 [Zychaea mexicana]|uniref:uncharacterized protein n=1 Tax=Zychaea mexicana TaxID=64656 RepID=UPI0022FEB9B0|nr:uncharacterized protein BDB00DRAFT_783347 [Zychaea mexicana]KAI9499267.1 hypothetical protein BDB00DRAFT_783347 [Zychaea mexicana]
MNISDILNHPQTISRPTSCFDAAETRLTSPPLSPKSTITTTSSTTNEFSYDPQLLQVHGKPRSRFSDIEDAIICDGVAKGLTWGQISRQLPHRKRATCFNRYRTLQGIRKSRKRGPTTAAAAAATESCINNSNKQTMAPPSPATTSSVSSASASPPWFPSTPPGSSSSSPVTTCSSSVADPTGFHLPSPRQILLNTEDHAIAQSSSDQCQPSLRLPPLIVPTARYPSQAP